MWRKRRDLLAGTIAAGPPLLANVMTATADDGGNCVLVRFGLTIPGEPGLRLVAEVLVPAAAIEEGLRDVVPPR